MNKETILDKIVNLEEFAFPDDYSILSDVKRFIESLETKGKFLKNVEFTPQRIETLNTLFEKYNSDEYLSELNFLLEQFKLAAENLNNLIPLMK